MKILSVLWCCFCSAVLTAQAPLEYNQRWIGTTFTTEEDRFITHFELMKLFEKDSEARRQYNRYLGLGVTSGFLAGGGLTLVVAAFEEGPDTEATERRVDWPFLISGILLTGGSIPLYISHHRAGRAAAAAYNLTLEQAPPVPERRVGLRMGTTPDRLGVQLRFGR